jgi:hypothetical protein
MTVEREPAHRESTLAGLVVQRSSAGSGRIHQPHCVGDAESDPGGGLDDVHDGRMRTVVVTPPAPSRKLRAECTNTAHGMLAHFANRFLFEAKVLPRSQGCRRLTPGRLGGAHTHDFRLKARQPCDHDRGRGLNRLRDRRFGPLPPEPITNPAKRHPQAVQKIRG